MKSKKRINNPTSLANSSLDITSKFNSVCDTIVKLNGHEIQNSITELSLVGKADGGKDLWDITMKLLVGRLHVNFGNRGNKK